MDVRYQNPYTPGAGHPPPYLAGREYEKKEFLALLNQTVIFENLVLTGLRGVGKTVLLDTFKPMAIQDQWMWVGTDLSESVSITEEKVALRILTDLSVVTSPVVIDSSLSQKPGFTGEQEEIFETLNFTNLVNIFSQAPGLVSDKLKYVLEFVWKRLKDQFSATKGVIFAYDEAQTMTDHADKGEYPLSLLLDVFQSIQKKRIPFMLVLAGLPTLFPKLVEARTYSERMFKVMYLDRLDEDASRDAIIKPVEDTDDAPLRFNEKSVETVIQVSGGYPYFIQFMCREVYDMWLRHLSRDDSQEIPPVPVNEILAKLDADFFAGRWAKATDRQRELLCVIAKMIGSDEEFTVQEAVNKSKEVLKKPFSASSVNQMLNTLINQGLVYRNRHGKYSFAVPLMDKFILRQREIENLDS